MEMFLMNLATRVKNFISSNKDSLFRSVAILAGGSALSQVLLVLASPILTRLYTPASFGIFTLYLSISQIFLTVISFRYELAISLPKEDENGGRILLLAIFLVVFNAILIGLAIYFWSDFASAHFNLVELRPYLWVLPLALIGAGFYQALSYWAIRKKAYGIIARTSFVKTLTTVLTQIIAGLFGWLPLGLLLGDFLGRLVGSGSLGRLAFDDNRHTLRETTPSKMFEQAHLYRNFALLSTPATLIDRLALYLPAILLAYYFTPQVVGWFGLGQQVIGVPISFIGQAVSQVFMGETSVYLRESPEKLKGLYLKFARNLFLFGFLPILALAVVAPWLIGLLFGQDWSIAGQYIQLLTPMYLTQIAVSPLSQTLNLLGRQSWQLVWEVAQLLLEVVCMYFAWRQQWGPPGVIAAFSFASFVAYIGLYLMSIYFLSQPAKSVST